MKSEDKRGDGLRELNGACGRTLWTAVELPASRSRGRRKCIVARFGAPIYSYKHNGSQCDSLDHKWDDD